MQVVGHPRKEKKKLLKSCNGTRLRLFFFVKVSVIIQMRTSKERSQEHFRLQLKSHEIVDSLYRQKQQWKRYHQNHKSFR